MSSLRIRTSGAEIYVEDHGGKPDQVLMLIHGGPGLPQSTAELASSPLLREYGSVYELHQRGTVQSPSEGPFTLSEHFEDLKIVLNELPSKAPVTLIGHSFGGLMSLLFASQNNELLSKLIVLGSPPLSPEAGQEMDHRIKSRLNPEELQRLKELISIKSDPSTSATQWEAADLEQVHLFFPKYQHDGQHPCEDLQARPKDVVLAANADYMKIRNSGALTEVFEKIEVPVIAFHGESDVLPASGSLPILEKHIENFQGHLIPEAGHFLWKEANCQEEFFPLLGEALSS